MRAWSEQSDITVVSEPEWESLVNNGIDTIVDPIILRTAEAFLAGRSGHTDWNSIAANLQELITFFNLLVYHPQIPMIDYGYTFLPADGFNVGRLYDVCNDISAGKMLAVSIGGAAYEKARTEALAALEVHGPIDPSIRDSIAREMTSFDYQWRPYLGSVLEPRLGPGETAERRAATFLYGGILFGVYAKRIGAAHLLPSKRASLEGETALDTPVERFRDEEKVFKQLDRIVAESTEFKPEQAALGAIPTVLPYLLGSYKPRNVLELMSFAIKESKEASVIALADMRRKLIATWREEAVIPDGIVLDLRRVGIMLNARMTPYMAPDATAGLSAYFFKALPVPRLWNWALSNVPGKNHIKLLYRLHASAQTRARTGDLNSSLEYSLRRLWESS